jgi:hypothetical protein
MRDGKEVGFPTEHAGRAQIDSPGRFLLSQEVVMWNWNSGILGPYLA